MRIDGSYLELSINTIHLLFSDFNDGEIQLINSDFINQKSLLMTNFVINTMKGYFNNSADSDEVTQVARDILRYRDSINKIHLIIVSTNKKSERLKTTLSLKPISIGNKEFNVDLTLLDIEGIFETKSASFKRDDIEIEIVNDSRMSESDCQLETNFGIFDCGIDMEMANLEKAIRSLCN